MLDKRTPELLAKMFSDEQEHQVCSTCGNDDRHLPLRYANNYGDALTHYCPPEPDTISACDIARVFAERDQLRAENALLKSLLAKNEV
jgi:hypothetical protein